MQMVKVHWTMSARLLAAVVHVHSEKLLVSNRHGGSMHGKQLKAAMLWLSGVFTL